MKWRPRKRFLLIIAIILAVSFGVWKFVLNRQPQVEYTTVKVERGKLTQTVSETGTLKPVHELELNFLTPGKIAKLPVKVGDQVKQGDTLAELDYADYAIKLREAEANLSVAQAKLNKLLAGAASEDVAVATAGYQAALDDLDKTKQSMDEAVAQAQKTYDDLTQVSASKSTYQQTYENKAEALLTTLDNKLIIGVAALDAVLRLTADNDIKNYLSIRNTAYLNQTKETHVLADTALDQAALKKTANVADLAGLNAYYTAMISALNLVFKDLNYCFNALEYSITAADFTQSELDAFKTTISTQSTTIATALSALQTAKQSLDDAKVAWDNATINARNALNTAKTAAKKQIAAAEAKVKTTTAELNRVSAKARAEDIALARGQVQQAQAAVDLSRSQLTSSAIKAPLTGVITKVNYQVGEQSTAAKVVVAMIAESSYEIEIDVSETDIAKVKLNDPATIILDAYGEGVKFTGQVIFIEPAETVIQGVTYYKVKINFSPDETHAVKPGMTATAAIITATKDDVLMIPARAIINKNDQQYVRILYGETAVEGLVRTGLTGDGGLVEVLAGVNEGDEVITYTKNNGK